MSGTVLALVGARSGSKGVPDKNVRPLAGHPLLAWSVTCARRCDMIDRVILSTDSEEYAGVGRRYGAEVPFLRPRELAADQSVDTDFVVHALDWLANRGEEPEFVVHLRPTTPLRRPAIVDEAVDAFRTAAYATALRSVHEMAESAYKTFEIADGLLRAVGSTSGSVEDTNAPRQSFPVTYVGNGYVDVLRTASIRSSGMLHGERVVPHLTDVVPEIDGPADMKYLEYLAGESRDLVKELFG